MISVILPTYERVDAVHCCLVALENQSKRGFEIVVVDDSTSDGIEQFFLDRSEPGRQDVSIRYMRSAPPRVGSFTAGRARNIGAANARGRLLVFVDQDVMLAPDALEHYEAAYCRHRDSAVIVGLYDWLPRMEFSPLDVRTNWERIVDQDFPKLPMDEPGLQGADLRTDDFSDDINAVVDDAALGAFSGNIGYPRSLFLRIGGFDEHIRGHGGEDADLGLTAKAFGAKFLLYKPIWGLHRWHTRNQAQNAREVQENIQYIDKKHGIGQYKDAKKFSGMDARDWGDWHHYTKEVGGVLMRLDGDVTIWACRDGHRIGIPSPEWIKRLGFAPGGELVTTPAGLSSYSVEGVASDD